MQWPVISAVRDAMTARDTARLMRSVGLGGSGADLIGELQSAFARDGGKRNSGVRQDTGWFFAANRQIAGRATGARFQVRIIKPAPDAGRHSARAVSDNPLWAHPFYDLIEAPNADESGTRFHWRQILQLQQAGASYVVVLPEVVEVTKDGAVAGRLTRIGQMRLLEPDRMSTAPDSETGRIKGSYIYRTRVGGKITYRAAPITRSERAAWFAEPYPFVFDIAIPDGWSYGASAPANAAGTALDTMFNLGELHNNQLKNGIHAGLIIMMLTKSEDPERFRQAVALLKAGIGKAGEPMVLPKDRFEVHDAPVSNKEMLFDTLDERSRQQVLAIAGGSDGTVGMSKDLNRATIWGLEHQLATGAIDPLNRLIADAYNRFLLPLYPGQGNQTRVYCQWDSSKLVDEGDVAKVEVAYVGGGIKTANESRALLGLPWHPDGDGLQKAGGPAQPDGAVPPDDQDTAETIEENAEDEDRARLDLHELLLERLTQPGGDV